MKMQMREWLRAILERKETKTYGLVLLFHLPGRVVHFDRNPALSKDQPLRGSWRDSHFFTYPVLFKRHGILARTHVLITPPTATR